MPAPEIKFYNSLTKSLEPFEPIAPPSVAMYNCGPTVYDYAHIGNFKSFLFADVLRRFLELAGYDVRQVMNLTDVGHMTDDAVADGGGQDKMAAAGERLAEAKKSGKLPQGVDLDPNDPYAIARFYGDAFIEDAKQLGIKVASEPDHLPRATDHVDNMQVIIKTLIEKGHAYVASDGAVYFSVQSFPSYGRLSGNTLDELRGGAGGRVSESNQAVKRHPADFLLWKPDESHLMKWDSPWGTGYPGWHIECSAMAKAVLKQDIIDIHTGGEDNIFPHHECEIAQSCGATGEDSFARFWMHGRHLMVEGQKMSKSKGNFYTVRQVIEGGFTGRAVDPAVLRLELIKAHYRSNMNFTAKGIEDSASAVKKVRVFAKEVAYDPAQASWHGVEHEALTEFIAALSDDLNTAKALGVMFAYLNEPAEDVVVSHAMLAAFDQVFAVINSAEAASAGGEADMVQNKIDAMNRARQDKDWATSDAVRAELEAEGYEVKQTKAGIVATKKLA
ncbi:MAG: cysteine--tRNA ligase [Phycisphaeraceae bacterium]|nr:cysteine--tRNA ligase [Phycisphaeraceae bacterium]